ncbi:MAG: low molecular weight phosphotyrosine protein phosphatase [Rhodospirillales bacterium]|nr:low molecular weight phosphotyrosine protein phosphatase [Rhodospirillales bacterium]
MKHQVPTVTRVLFVCTGNICRSPTAEGVFRHVAAEAGLADRFHVDSAGTHGYHLGEPPDARAVALALKRGYDLSALRARQFTAADYADFDLLLAMDRGHLKIMRRLAPPRDAERARLFLSYAPACGIDDVPDPYYGDERDFARTLDLIERGSRALLDALIRPESR